MLIVSLSTGVSHVPMYITCSETTDSKTAIITLQFMWKSPLRTAQWPQRDNRTRYRVISCVASTTQRRVSARYKLVKCGQAVAVGRCRSQLVAGATMSPPAARCVFAMSSVNHILFLRRRRQVMLTAAPHYRSHDRLIDWTYVQRRRRRQSH